MTRVSDLDLELLLRRTKKASPLNSVYLNSTDLRMLIEEIQAYRKKEEEPQMENEESWNKRKVGFCTVEELFYK